MAKTSIKQIMEYWKNSDWKLKQVFTNWPECKSSPLRTLEVVGSVFYKESQNDIRFYKNRIKDYSTAKAIWNNRLMKLIDDETYYFCVYVYYVTPISKKCVEIHESFRKEMNL